MRKVLLVILAGMLVFMLTGAAAAKGYKPPKSICLEFVGYSGRGLCLTVKSLGKMTFMDKQKVQYYSIAGTVHVGDDHTQIGGSGSMEGSDFRFQMSGYVPDHIIKVSGYIDMSEEPANGLATLYEMNITEATSDQVSFELIEVPCDTLLGPGTL